MPQRRNSQGMMGMENAFNKVNLLDKYCKIANRKTLKISENLYTIIQGSQELQWNSINRSLNLVTFYGDYEEWNEKGMLYTKIPPLHEVAQRLFLS